MKTHLVVWIAVAGLIAAAGAAHGQGEPASKNKRLVYVVKYGSAKDLANVLGKHFKGDAEVQALPESPSNCLLISAPPAVFEEVVKVLEQIDRKPRQVAIEIMLVEGTPQKEGDKGIDEGPLSGSIKDVESALSDLQRKGQLAGIRRIRLTALEDRPASTLFGESKPFTAGVTTTATGMSARSMMYRQLGTSVNVTAQIAPDKSVLLDLGVEDQRAATPDTAPEIGKDENGKAVHATEFIASNLKTKLSVAPGQAVAAKGVKTTSKGSPAQTIIIVTARVEPEPEGSK